MTKKWIIEISTALLIALWVYAALSKLLVYDSFRFQLLGHKLIVNYASLVAWAVPAFELLIAILLLVPKTKRIGLYLSFGMLGIFTAYIIYMFNFYPNTPCSCGGVINKLTWQQHIVFNLAFMLLAAAALWLSGNNRPRINTSAFTPA